MTLQNIKHEGLQQLLTEINLASDNHNSWYNDLVRTIACRLTPDKRNMIANAHKECRFGQWYYSNALIDIKDHPSIVAIGATHHHMHQLVTHILSNLKITNIISPFDFDKLSNAVEQFRLEILTFKKELETLLLNRDPLTMTINRVNILPFLREQQEVIKRHHLPCCIVMLDIDLFKNVNNQHGHLAGDKVLIILAQYLIDHLRLYDKIFRYGGEEFLIFIQETDLLRSYEMVEHLREEISSMPFDIGLPEPIHITTSCGVTLIEPNLAIEELIEQANKALYLAKSSGRNKTQVWSTDVGQKTMR